MSEDDGVIDYECCATCRFRVWGSNNDRCRRFPKHVDISISDLHWCGEWKPKDDSKKETI